MTDGCDHSFFDKFVAFEVVFQDDRYLSTTSGSDSLGVGVGFLKKFKALVVRDWESLLAGSGGKGFSLELVFVRRVPSPWEELELSVGTSLGAAERAEESRSCLKLLWLGGTCVLVVAVTSEFSTVGPPTRDPRLAKLADMDLVVVVPTAGGGASSGSVDDSETQSSTLRTKINESLLEKSGPREFLTGPMGAEIRGG